MNDFSSMRLSECYRLLRVSPGIGWREIKKSYHDLAKKLHPDANPGDPENELRFKEISQAYKILELHCQSLNSKKKPDLEPTSDSFPRVMEDDFEIPRGVNWFWKRISERRRFWRREFDFWNLPPTSTNIP